jgi:ATP-binding cassette, subfamily F, member 3
MSLISASDLAKSYGAEDLFGRVSLAVPHQARIALVGPNGVGKTTLLRILVGLERPDRGLVQRARSLRIGYLPQEVDSRVFGASGAQTLYDLCLGAFAALRDQEAELSRLETEMEDPHRAAEALGRYGPLQESFERAGGYVYPTRIRQVLTGLGFAPEDHPQPLARLSGGEQTRAHLARLLLEDPDLLVLDEPTNHLDLQAIEWLEGWLRDWPGAALIVSHDRFLLDQAVEAVWELTPGGVETYHGNYSAYVQQRTQRRQLQLDANRSQEEHVRKEQEYIRRNIAGQNTRQAQGRRKRLERLLRDSPLTAPRNDRRVHIDFGAAERSGDRVIETMDLAVGFADGQTPLFRVPDLVLTRGECAALIGPNGAGKTTFLRTLLAELPSRAGRVRLGAGVHVGYFAQAHAGLKPDPAVLDVILAAAPAMKPAEARNLLARFLFTGDSVFKPVQVLSGGERARLALIVLILEGANLLLLDEPTTHLDLPSQEILQQALTTFPGTILLVSHDRYLINALATQIWAVSPEEKELTVFPGGYADYAQWLKAAAQSVPVARPTRPDTDPRPRRVRPEPVDRVLQRIHELEQALGELSREIERAGTDVDRVRVLGQDYQAAERELQEQMAEWERLEAERNRA